MFSIENRTCDHCKNISCSFVVVVMVVPPALLWTMLPWMMLDRKKTPLRDVWLFQNDNDNQQWQQAMAISNGKQHWQEATNKQALGQASLANLSQTGLSCMTPRHAARPGGALPATRSHPQHACFQLVFPPASRIITFFKMTVDSICMFFNNGNDNQQ